MKKKKIYNVIGVMTGTSMDGIDISYCSTDGHKILKIHSENTYTYSTIQRNEIKKITKKEIQIKQLMRVINVNFSNVLISAISKFININEIKKSKVDFISLSGQTIQHNPKDKTSIQLGLPQYISDKLKLNTVSDFRINDIVAGGQGAPIGAYYHKYLIKKISLKSMIINLGGVANFSLIYRNKLISSDIGPANAISDDLMYYFFKKNFDKNGIVAAKGELNKNILNLFTKDKFFKKKYPKSLDRNYFYFIFKKLIKLKSNNAITTAIYFTIYSILILLQNKICKEIKEVIITGGGRKNKFLMNTLKEIKSNLKISLIDDYGLNGDLIEAQMFAYIGVRSLKRYVLSSRLTTGVSRSISGGRLYKFKS